MLILDGAAPRFLGKISGTSTENSMTSPVRGWVKPSVLAWRNRPWPSRSCEGHRLHHQRPDGQCRPCEPESGGPSCLHCNSDQTIIPETLQDVETGQSWFPFSCHSLLLAILVTPSNRRLNDTPIVWKIAVTMAHILAQGLSALSSSASATWAASFLATMRRPEVSFQSGWIDPDEAHH